MEHYVLHSNAREKARKICMFLVRMPAAQKPEQEQACCGKTKA
jgi:hypothetical protein